MGLKAVPRKKFDKVLQALLQQPKVEETLPQQPEVEEGTRVKVKDSSAGKDIEFDVIVPSGAKTEDLRRAIASASPDIQGANTRKIACKGKFLKPDQELAKHADLISGTGFVVLIGA